MSAAQFSSKKMLKELKEQDFCRKIWLTQRPLFTAFSKKTLHLNVALKMSAAQFSSKMLKNLKEQGFCTKVLLAQRQLPELFSCKDILCSFCELPAWWKTSQAPLLTKIRDFESTEISIIKLEIWKAKFYLVCELPAWWKSTQTHLLTKVRDFERSAASKTWKSNFTHFFTRSLGENYSNSSFRQK